MVQSSGLTAFMRTLKRSVSGGEMAMPSGPILALLCTGTAQLHALVHAEDVTTRPASAWASAAALWKGAFSQRCGPSMSVSGSAMVRHSLNLSAAACPWRWYVREEATTNRRVRQGGAVCLQKGAFSQIHGPLMSVSGSDMVRHSLTLSAPRLASHLHNRTI